MSEGPLVSFLAPAWLWLGVVGLLVLILHARRRRTLEIPSVQLWRLLESGTRLRQRLRLPLPNVLLLLQLAVVALIALALARPVIGPRFAHEIVVIDASGEMRMTARAKYSDFSIRPRPKRRLLRTNPGNWPI